MSTRTKIIILFFLFFYTGFAAAENNTSLLKLDLPLFDFPYQIDAMDTVGHGFFSSYANPSMSQSLAVATDTFSSFHYGMRLFYDSTKMNEVWKNIIYYGGTALGDFALMLLPFGGDAWMHEEFHRALMSRYGINSFNSVYIFGNYVNHVTDEDLKRFKAESPIDFIRLHEAGIEGEYLLVDNLHEIIFSITKNTFPNWYTGTSLSMIIGI